MGKVLSQHFSSFKELQDATVLRLCQIEGISDITAQYIHEGVNGVTPRLVLDQGVKIDYSKARTTTPSGQTSISSFLEGEEGFEVSKGSVYVTGKIEGMTKKEVQSFVESKGYEWSTSISGKLNLLVLGDAAGGSKVAKAKKLGIEMMTWDEFMSSL